MAITNAIENFKMIVNKAFVAKAEALTPSLIKLWSNLFVP